MSINMEMYSADAPVALKVEDKFNRFPFAKQVANVISKRGDSSSIVISINGAWGEGKTSVLNFIEGELLEEPEVVCIRFNPWRFGEEDQMLVNFFNDMATAIERTLETGKEKIGEAIDKYIKPAMNILGKGEIAEGVSSFFTNADIEELRIRIEGALEQEKKRVVILIDDIDRLEKNEIYSIFRLVKLTGDFRYTAYVLAFDKDMVSAALQDRYSAGNQNAGKSFLEKIIQVPLQLPLIDSEDLRLYYLKGVENALAIAEVELSNAEAQRFMNNFTHVEKLLKTPRQAMLYSNTLTFSLPLLKGEVNTIDLMLIEALRVFSPNVYELIRNNQNIFIDDSTSLGRRDEEEIKKRKNLIITAIKSTSDEVNEILKILLYLFPKLNNIFGNTSYGSDWEKQWNENQRICSSQYFQRYFTYSIPKGDIPDYFINDLLFSTDKFISSEEILERIEEVITIRNAEVLISKIRSRTEKIKTEKSKVLALAISKLGDKLPNPQTLFFSNAYYRGAMLTGDLVESLERKSEQIELANSIIESASSLNFAIDCFSWFRKDKKENPNPNGFTEQEMNIVGRTLANRISMELESSQNIEEKALPIKISLWNKYGEQEEARTWLKERAVAEPKLIIGFLKEYLPTAWNEEGPFISIEFERDHYLSLREIIDPEDVKKALEKVVGDLNYEGEHPRPADVTFEEKLAKQFLRIHHQITKEESNI